MAGSSSTSRSGSGSTNVVGWVKRALREAGEPKTRVGHGGTLDPLATGVLPIAIGEATKLAGHMLGATKGYDFTIASGRRPTRSTSKARSSRPASTCPTRAEVEAILPRFTGPIEQVPPAYSALKVDGQRAYDLARAGEEFELKTRAVTILLRSTLRRRRRRAIGRPSPPPSPKAPTSAASRATSRWRSARSATSPCSGAPGPVRSTLEQAISLDFLDEAAKARALTRVVLPLTAGLDDIPALPVTPDDARLLRVGQRLVGNPAQSGLYLATDAERPIALVEVAAGDVKVVRGFNI